MVNFLCEFIKLYRQNECLWDKNSNDFCDISKRRKAYNILRKKYSEIDKNVTEKYIKTKINNLRYNFFKELKKFEKSKKKGDIYEPSIWYFNQLSFLAQREIPKVEEKHDKICDIQHCSPAFVKEFIIIYKTNECLWNVKSPNYYNREVKLRAYEELRQKLLAIDKNATIATVKRRISSLRTHFTYYQKNLQNPKSELKLPETNYIFDLMFLRGEIPEYNIESENSSRECDSPNKSEILEQMDIEDYRMQSQNDNVLELASNEIFIKEQTYDDDEEDVIDQPILDDVKEIFEIVSQNSNNKDELKTEKETNQTVTNSKLTRYTKTSKDSEQISNRKTRTGTESKNESKKEINTEQSQNISESVPEKLINIEDECGTYAKYVANEMKLLLPKDQLFLQKLFNDTLFEARLGNVRKLKLTIGK